MFIRERVPRYVIHAIIIISIVVAATIDFSLIQARLPIQSKGGHDTSPYVVECSRIKWVWLQSLAVYDCLFVLKRGIKAARLSFTAVWHGNYRSYIDYSKFSPHKPAI